VGEQKRNETGAELVAKGSFSSDQSTDVLYLTGAPDGQKYRYESKSETPEVLRRSVGNGTPDQAETLMDACQGIARRARDAFKEACEIADVDQAEANFLEAKDKLKDLWNYAYLRDRPFRDLLALLQASVTSGNLSDFGSHQKDVLRQAFADLPKLFLEDKLVEQHIDRFAEHELDGVVAPIRQPQGKRLRITIEEVD
jgi:hypothetical protein